MEHRKIQLVAGTTYQISLPKPWVQKNNLKEGKELLVLERSDRSLIITTHYEESLTREKITINVDLYQNQIDRVLFELYYVGFSIIDLISKHPLEKKTKGIIRQTINCMSGTEITYEDEHKITVTVMLDRSKVDITQALYRIVLLIKQSIDHLIEEQDGEDLELNEEEIDRLYHLITKIVSLAAIRTDILLSSKIKHAGVIPNYFLVAKKLENIGDDIFFLGKEHRSREKIKMTNEEKEILLFLQSELDRTIRCILADFPSVLTRPEHYESERTKARGLKHHKHEYYNLLRNLKDIQEEVMSISFLKQIVREGKI